MAALLLAACAALCLFVVEVRAVNADRDGPWSATHTAVTSDHGATSALATPLALASPVEGRIESATDVDRFRIRVTTQTDVRIYSTGALDTRATLYSASNAVICGGGGSGAQGPTWARTARLSIRSRS